MSTEGEAILFTDGCSLGNPGPAGAGFVLQGPDETVLAERAIPLGETTGSVAEYRALIAGLSEALSRGLRRVRVFSDSEFMCRQLQGRYKVRAANIKPLYQWAQKLISQFEEFRIEHINREGNLRADALAKEAGRRAQHRAQ